MLANRPRQLALRFLVRRESLFSIPKAAKVAHLEENAGGGALGIDDETVAALEAAFPLGRSKELPTL